MSQLVAPFVVATPARRVRWVWGSVVSVLGVVLATAVLQSVEVRKLREEVRTWRHRAQWPAVGFGVPPMHARDLNGEPRLLAAGPVQSQVIAVFTASCPYCRASQPEWRALAARLDSLDRAKFTWLSLSAIDSTTSYAREHQLPTSAVALGAEQPLLRAARIRGVPLTLVVDSIGIVRYVHTGVFTRHDADSVIAVLANPQPAPRRDVRRVPAVTDTSVTRR